MDNGGSFFMSLYEGRRIDDSWLRDVLKYAPGWHTAKRVSFYAAPGITMNAIPAANIAVRNSLAV